MGVFNLSVVDRGNVIFQILAYYSYFWYTVRLVAVARGISGT